MRGSLNTHSIAHHLDTMTWRQTARRKGSDRGSASNTDAALLFLSSLLGTGHQELYITYTHGYIVRYFLLRFYQMNDYLVRQTDRTDRESLRACPTLPLSPLFSPTFLGLTSHTGKK